MRDLLSIGTSRGYSMAGLGIGLGLSEFRLTSPIPQIDPSSITGLVFWIDANDSSTIYQSAGGSSAIADGDPVGQWQDKSTSACHLSQTDPTKKPALKVSIKNNRNAVRWDTVNDSLNNTVTALIGNAFTLFVAKTSPTYKNQITLFSSTGTRPFIYDEKDGGSYDYHGYSGVYTANARYTSAISGSTNVYSITVYNGSILSFYRNGSQLTSNGSITHGLVANTSELSLLGADVYEILIYNSSLSATDRQSVESYLNSKWSIY